MPKWSVCVGIREYSRDMAELSDQFSGAGDLAPTGVASATKLVECGVSEVTMKHSDAEAH